MLNTSATTTVTVQSNVMVPMRDGVQLATDIYLPVMAEGPPGALPVIMERTPYDKSGVSRSEAVPWQKTPLTRPQLARFFAERGYAVVMQDVRGRHASEGEFTKYVNEANDGLDTMNWLMMQPWCNGRVGTMGLSYGAHTQMALACMNPPGLACMFMDSGGFSSAYHGGIRRGGAFELKQVTWAFRHALASELTQRDPARKLALESTDIQAWFRNMPWSPGNSPLSPAPEFENYLFEQWHAGRFDEYWKRPGLYAEGYYQQIPDIPISIVGSWYDPYALACTVNYIALARAHESAVHLLMGPWTHGNRSYSFAGNVDFGVQAQLENSVANNYPQYRLDWFDRFLHHREVPALEARGVRYFRMGGGSGDKDPAGRMQHGGQWLNSDCWPPAGSQTQQFYFHADGTLLAQKPVEPDALLDYVHDPSNPVPTIGGAVTSGDPVMEGGAFDQRITADVLTYRQDTPQIALARRDDVLVFETAPLEEDLDLTGNVSADLWISSDCPDTDFCIKLLDVYPPCADYPEGYAMNITDGIFRARYRDGWDKEVMMQPGEVYQLRVEAFPTSNLFKKGHRLRVDIASSNYPHFDINPNNGGPVGSAGTFMVARNRVHCSSRFPSCIRLSRQA